VRLVVAGAIVAIDKPLVGHRRSLGVGRALVRATRRLPSLRAAGRQGDDAISSSLATCGSRSGSSRRAGLDQVAGAAAHRSRRQAESAPRPLLASIHGDALPPALIVGDPPDTLDRSRIDDFGLAADLRIEERELEAGGLDWRARRKRKRRCVALGSASEVA